MAGIFVLGEEKVRPGSYFRIKKNGDDSTTEVINGVTVVVFRSDFGPLGKASILGRDEGYENPTFLCIMSAMALRFTAAMMRKNTGTATGFII